MVDSSACGVSGSSRRRSRVKCNIRRCSSFRQEEEELSLAVQLSVLRRHPSARVTNDALLDPVGETGRGDETAAIGIRESSKTVEESSGEEPVSAVLDR